MASEHEQEYEQCWLITGKTIGPFWIGRRTLLANGSPTRVHFDCDTVLNRQTEKGDVIGFLHTHPITDATPSATDHATMNAWTDSLGKPLICAIVGRSGIASFRYEQDNDDQPIPGWIWKIGNVVLGLTI